MAHMITGNAAEIHTALFGAGPSPAESATVALRNALRNHRNVHAYAAALPNVNFGREIGVSGRAINRHVLALIQAGE